MIVDAREDKILKKEKEIEDKVEEL